MFEIVIIFFIFFSVLFPIVDKHSSHTDRILCYLLQLRFFTTKKKLFCLRGLAFVRNGRPPWKRNRLKEYDRYCAFPRKVGHFWTSSQLRSNKIRAPKAPDEINSNWIFFIIQRNISSNRKNGPTSVHEHVLYGKATSMANLKTF